MSTPSAGTPAPATGSGSKVGWLWPAVVIVLVVLLGITVVQKQQADKRAEEALRTAAAPAPTSNPSTSGAPGVFAEAAKTWNDVEEANTRLEETIRDGKLDEVHSAAFDLRDQVRELPGESAALPEPTRKQLESEVRHVDDVAKMLDEAGDSKDGESVHKHHMAMDEALVRIRELYPEGTLPPHRRMHGGGDAPMGGMGSGKMGDDKMGSPGMGGGTMGDDKMGGMSGGSMGSAPKSDSGSGGMGGGMMGDDKMGGAGKGGGMMGDDKMGGMPMGTGMMDMMMSEMPPADKMPMKGMMDKMMAMPPAERKKAMKKMGGMAMPGGKNSKSPMAADPTMKKLMSGMSPEDAAQMKATMEKMMAMPPAERKKAMQKMSDTPMPGGMGGGGMKDDAGDM